MLTTDALVGVLQGLAEGRGAALWPQLLDAVRRRVPCDAAALLRLDGDLLTPLALHGLSPDTLGRRFRLAEHPRLQAVAADSGPVRFPADCTLPDPYDGLIPDVEGRLHVHDCVGVPLRLPASGRLWGVLTLDTLQGGRLVGSEPVLAEVARVIAAILSVIERQNQLAERLARAGEVRRVLTDALGTADELIGDSAAVTAMLAEVDAVADSDLAVLVQGETGVGKELVARRLHRRSARAEAPLVQVNCAALPETLVESELFGHVRGAFSGAIADRRGRFELADGGTLFLDEVGELPAAVQAKLLRVLQNGEIQRVGSDRFLRVDVRIIAATNRDLAGEVAAGRFRADLYHRLSVYPVRVPPLRERGDDVLTLAGHFLENNRARLRLRNLRLSAAAERWLQDYAWPGNVRELEHAISRASIRALGAGAAAGGMLTLEPGDLAPADAAAPPQRAASRPAPAIPAGLTLREAVDELQRRMILEQVAAEGGNWAAAGRVLGLDRSNLFRLARRLGLHAPEAGQ
jgi:anaerobic nitric oxide reductase transcription regulator